MATVHARTFDYAVTLDDAWTARSDRGGEPLPHDGDVWTPEHLVLAGLARCTLAALRHHAGRAGIEVTCSGGASGTVTQRDEDGRFAFVEIAFEGTVGFEPAQGPAAARELLERAERDCFVGASLTVTPTYGWVSDGTPLA